MESDAELIKLINQGDLDAFERLYHRYRNRVYNLAWRFCSDEQLAQDVVQETFIYLLKKFPGFELTAKMTSFLYLTVKHISLNMVKKKHKFQSAAHEFEEIPDTSNGRDCPDRSDLAAALSTLPDEQSEIVLMRFVDDMTLEEISETLKIGLSAVKSRLYRALEKLRNDSRCKKYFLG